MSIELRYWNFRNTSQAHLPPLEKGMFRKEPLRVVSMKVKGKPIESVKKFVEEDD